MADENGVSLRETLTGLLERTKQKKKRAEYEQQLVTPPLPVSARHVWNWYWRIRRRKGSGGFGPSPIEWPDIDAFARNAKVKFSEWEMEVIEMLDDTFLAEHNKHQRKEQE